MILPRYSIRTLLVATSIAAVVSLVMRQAILGRAWAIGCSVAVATAILLLLIHMLLFTIANLFVAVRKSFRRPVSGQSPFASAGLPRQIVAPVDPE